MGPRAMGKQTRRTKSSRKPPVRNKRKQSKYKNEEPIKKQRIEQVPLPPVEDDSSEDEEDSVKQLLQTFSINLLKKSRLAVDSSDEEEENKSDSADELEDKTEEDIETQEALEEEIDIEVQKEEEDTVDVSDPFSLHLLYDLSENLVNSLQATQKQEKKEVEEWPELGKLFIQIPECEGVIEESKFSIDGCKRFASVGTVPKGVDVTVKSLSNLHIKSQLRNHIMEANPAALQQPNVLTHFQGELFSIINNYQDLLYNQRIFDNCDDIRFVYCLHVVNHILKTRIKVLHHNAKLATKSDVPEEYRDQGLVRPKILIIAPFRDSAYKIITQLIKILIPEDKGNVINKKRFLSQFTGHEITMPKRNPKPEDYEKLFSGNSGDDFRIGMTVTKKSLKLFTDFYSSDIIIASPLGLRTIIGAEGETERDYDFLASIELLILDQAEVFLMQNWDHLLHVFNHMHLQPKESHGTDFSRVRTWSLNGWAKYYRQTLIFSSLMLPEINSLFNKRCWNYAGKVKIVNPIVLGSICQVFVQLPHVFQKIEANSVANGVEARFKFFIDKIVPQQRDALMKQTVVYVPQYFDFVKLRNYFKREDINFVQICEYSKEGKIARARDMFFHGDAHFLLYTERFHFFNRIKLKGIRHLVFYQPPTFPHFYYELCNLMQEAYMNNKIGNTSNMTVTILYTKYDINQLACIVGTERAAKMINSDRNVHMLVTDKDKSNR